MLSPEYSGLLYHTRRVVKVTPWSGYWGNAVHQTLQSDPGVIAVLLASSIPTPSLSDIEPDSFSATAGAWYFRHRCFVPGRGHSVATLFLLPPESPVPSSHCPYWFCRSFPQCRCNKEDNIYRYSFMYLLPTN